MFKQNTLFGIVFDVITEVLQITFYLNRYNSNKLIQHTVTKFNYQGSLR